MTTSSQIELIKLFSRSELSSKTRYMDMSDDSDSEEEKDWDKCDVQPSETKQKSKARKK